MSQQLSSQDERLGISRTGVRKAPIEAEKERLVFDKHIRSSIHSFVLLKVF